MIEQFHVNVIYNTVTPSSAGAICAANFVPVLSGNIVNSLVPSSGTIELLNDVEWIMAMG